MKRRALTSKYQSGVALLALLFALILAGGYAFYRSANTGFGASQQETKLTLKLARAKEALIAYAVIDTKRPGRMLCPDILGEGNSDWSLSRTYCDTSSGWLPWKTLGLTDGTDDHGTKFWYAFSPIFSGTQGTPLNSDTLTSLRVDVPAGSSSNDVVAVIIATHGTLDTRNADGDEYYFNGTSKNPDDNDVITVITRQELMAAVEKRIASEIRTCLEQHAASAPDAAYPWPAPLSNNIYKGQAKSLFGMIPETQPGGNPDELLKQTTQDLENAKATFATALTSDNANAKLAAVVQLQSTAAYARALYDRVYIVATDLYNKAASLATSFNTLDSTLAAITANSSAFTAGGNGIPAALDLAQPALEAFRTALGNSGFDIFLMELQSENTKLLSKITLATASPSENMAALQTQANVFKSKLLANSLTPNLELSVLLNTNLGLASSAVDAAKAAKALPADEALVAAAIRAATSLATANQTLDQTIQAIRLNLDPLTIEIPNQNAIQALDRFAANPDPANTTALALSLSSLRANVGLISRGSNAVMSGKASLLTSLEQAVDAATAGSNSSLIQARSSTATSQANALILAMQNNGDNIARATLTIVADLLAASELTPPTTLSAGRDLRDLGKLVGYWADNASAYAKSVAQQARKKPDAENDSDNSAYIAAQKLLAGLDGETGTIQLLEEAIKSPADTSAQTAAQSALNKTENFLNTLDTRSSRLESTLQAGLADAVTPTKWYGSACTFLQPATGSASWWVANQWFKYLFYQTSDHTRPLPANQKCVGKLKVNGAGEYCVVALSAGKALTGQPRNTREVSQYFDDPINADSSRNVDAQNPSVNFSSKAVSATFNDRLAY
jgi:hypothetical protein